jgi:hypothetical protein
MPSLSEVIADPARRRAVIDDATRVLEAEVSDKGGLTGLAIKGGFATVKRLKPDFVPGSLNMLMDDFARQIDPFWERCRTSGADARAFFTREGGAVADALLVITDGKARNVAGPVRAVYDQLRPKAREHVIAAMPRLGDLVRRHAS